MSAARCNPLALPASCLALSTRRLSPALVCKRWARCWLEGPLWRDVRMAAGAPVADLSPSCLDAWLAPRRRALQRVRGTVQSLKLEGCMPAGEEQEEAQVDPDQPPPLEADGSGPSREQCRRLGGRMAGELVSSALAGGAPVLRDLSLHLWGLHLSWPETAAIQSCTALECLEVRPPGEGANPAGFAVLPASTAPALASLRALTRLRLCAQRITGAVFEAVLGLPALKILALVSEAPLPAGTHRLSELPALADLQLVELSSTAQGLRLPAVKGLRASAPAVQVMSRPLASALACCPRSGLPARLAAAPAVAHACFPPFLYPLPLRRCRRMGS